MLIFYHFETSLSSYMTTDIMTIQCCPTVREAPFLIKIILHSYNFIMHANIFTIFYANLVTTTDETLYRH